MNIEHVLEFSRPDVDGNVIRAVKIIGLKSKHGWAYSPAVLKEAIPLYESSPVFIEHPDAREKKKGHRQLGDHFGSLENIQGNGQGLWGDLKIKPSHPLAESVLESATSGRFGLSHNAVVEMDDAKTNVTRIVEVNSVDLVNNPATTENLFEGQGVQTEAKEFLEEFREGMTTMDRLCESLKAIIESKPPPKPPQRLVAFEAKGAGENGEAIGDDHEAFLSTLKGY